MSVLTLLTAGAPARASNLLARSVPSPVSSATAGAIANAQQAAAIALQAQNTLARATQAIQAMQAAQSAARNLALQAPSAIPDGLAAGGLAPNMAAGWSGANAPTQSAANGQTTVTINQMAPQALLNWQSFNVSKNTTVDFNQQGNATWVALNRIAATGVPSQILGQIKADGSVYVINPNGIIFGGASQVNVNALIASSADISTSQFLNNGIYSTQSNTSYVPSFTNAGGAITVQAGAQITTNAPSSVTSGGGFVLLMGTQVQNAGSIATPDGQTEFAAGDNFLIRPGYGTQTNSWSTTRSNEIAVQLNQQGSSLSGGSGFVTNSGYIEADTGDITLAGETVVQSGVLISSTSVNTRGTIHLLSSASDPSSSVTLTGGSFAAILPDTSGGTALNSQRAALIADSATQDAARQTGANAQFDDLSTLTDMEDESRIEIVTGGTAEFQNGSLTLANGGQVAVSAVKRVQADSGATIDVSGLVNVALPMSANDIAVNIQGNELRDDPNNRETGNLFSNTVYVDARDLTLVPAGTGGYASDRYYTQGGLLEVSGWLNTTPHTIGEWMAVGGSITLSTGSGGAVVAQTGSTFNISGGSVQYQAGFLPQSYLLGTDGRVYNVNSAPADITYAGVYNGFVVDHPRWGVTQTYRATLSAPAEIYEPGYTVGRDAGSLILSTPTSVFEGNIEAGATEGIERTSARPATVADAYLLPQDIVPLQGTLSLFNVLNAVATAANGGVQDAAFASDVQIADGVAPIADTLSPSSAIPADRINTAWFDVGQMNGFDLGGLTLASTKNVTIAAGAPLTLAPGGHLVLAALSIEIGADVTIPSGSITAGGIFSYLLPGAATPTPMPVAGNRQVGSVKVDPGVTLDLRGLWTNAFNAPADQTGEAFVNGGTVLFQGTITLGQGSVIDTSSGAAITPAGKFVGGQGGNITLDAEIYNGNVLGGGADFSAGELYSYGVTGGGVLTIQSPGSVQITNDDTVTGAGVVHPDFFTHGFSNYDIDATGGITVADNTVVNVVEPVYQQNADSATFATGTDLNQVLGAPVLPPLFLENPATATLTQRAGAGLRLSAGPLLTGLKSGSSVTVGVGAVLQVDPLQSITLESYGQLTVDGTLTAHGGAIKLVDDQTGGAGTLYTLGPTSDPTATFIPGLSIWIGSDAVLDASGIAVQATDQYGLPYGEALAGGSIIVGGDGMTRDDNGFYQLIAPILVRPGALLDVSGASTSTAIDPNAGVRPGALLDAPVGSGGLTPIASDAGSMTFSSFYGVFLDGTLEAQAGGPTASGGSLTVVLRDGFPGQNNLTPRPGTSPVNIVLDQTYQPTDFDPSLQPGQCFIGCVAGQADPPANYTAGHASMNVVHIGVDMVEAAGFDSLSLTSDNNIVFNGAVNLSLGRSLTLSSGVIGDTDPTAKVVVSAPYVAVGLPYANDASASTVIGTAPSTGTGTFTVDADQIDVTGILQFGLFNTFSSFSLVTLDSQGDMRFGQISSGPPQGFVNNLRTWGDLTLDAAQIYPPTGSTASISVGPVNANNAYISGTLTINGTGDTPAVPMSVLGSLTLSAYAINQGGVLRAPEGALTLQAGAGGVNLLPGSLTSVSLEGVTIPFGGTVDGVNWTMPVSQSPGGEGTFYFGPSMTISGDLTVSQGAVLDLSGGGTLAGAGFISGAGGSTDTRLAALFPKQSTGIYAIIPGYASGYAPTASIDASSAYPGLIPGVGSTITVPAGVPGLPAGTYTLLPSEYLLQPGAFRVELDGAARFNAPATALGDGSYQVAAFTGVSNTAIRSSTPVVATITSGTVARTYSQYDETTYDQFVLAGPAATVFGQPRNFIAADGKYLTLSAPSGLALSFDGTALFRAADGGEAGGVVLTGQSLEIIPEGRTPTAGFASYTDADLNRMGAPDLFIGGGVSVGTTGYEDNGGTATTNDGVTLSLVGSATSTLAVRAGVDLQAPDIFLQTNLDGSILVESGATLSSVGKGASSIITNGATYAGLGCSATGTAACGDNVLAVANGVFYLTAPSVATTGSITVQDGATLASDGTVAFSGSGAINLSEKANYFASNIAFGAASINIGADGTPNAVVPAGFTFTQALLNALLQGDPATGAPGVQRLALTATNSLNLFGTTTLDAGGAEIDLSTPAIYGYGGAGDVATLKAGTLVWNGLAGTATVNDTLSDTGTTTIPASASSGPVVANGPGTGAGSLDIVANTILLGAPDTTVPNPAVSLDHLVSGFANVNLAAATEITANGKGSLSVYQTAPTAVGGVGAGGNLTLTTPLLTTQSGAVLAIAAGGGVSVQAPAGVAPAATSTVTTTGGEIDITGSAIAIDTAVALPSGRLQLTANGAITLGGDAMIDVAGRAITMVDQTEYSFGGDVQMSSADGNITQAAGSIIDISAVNNAAGTLDLTAINAAAGSVILAGAIKGDASGTYDAGGTLVPYAAGSIDIEAQQIGSDPNNLSADFAALNRRLDAGGVTGSRSFDIKQGNLVISGAVTAQQVFVSIDAGSLEVSGVINASGQQPGSIELAAKNNLTIDTSAVLDAHGTVLRVDSYGNPIFSNNRATVTLSTVDGVLTLSPGATIDMRVTDARNVDAAGDQIVNYGDLELDAPRTGGTVASATNGATVTDPVDGARPTDGAGPANAQGTGIAIQAGGTLDIMGAGTIALNGFATYANAPKDPNDSNGQIIDQGYLELIDTDSQAFMTNAAANGTLQQNIAGLTAYGANFHLRPGVEIDSATPGGDLTVTSNIDLSGYRYGPNADTNPADANYGAGEPMDLVIRGGGNVTVNGSISDGFGLPATTLVPGSSTPVAFTNTSYFGAQTPSHVDLGDGTQMFSLNPGVVLYVLTDWTVPTIRARIILSTISDLYATDPIACANCSVPNTRFTTSDVIQAGTEIEVPSGKAVYFDPTDAPQLGTSYSPPRQVPLPEVTAPMLAANSLSASIRLVAGADLAAADTSILQAASALGASGNLTLSDPTQVDALKPIPDVIRTGTGSLSLLASGDISVDSLYGVYTAGTQTPAITVTGASDTSNTRNVYDLATANFGTAANTYYPDQGGNLTIQAQGDFSGYNQTIGPSDLGPSTDNANSSYIADWLVRQGDSALGQATAWGINFGAVNVNFTTTTVVTGFTGFGTLGGGNVTVDVGGNAGLVTPVTTQTAYNAGAYGGLVIAVGGTARVLDSGHVVETGGGDINIHIDGVLNPSPPILGAFQTAQIVSDQMAGGTLTDLRGHVDLSAGAIGEMIGAYGVQTSSNIDPVLPNPQMANFASATLGGLLLAPGDSTMQLSTRGDLVLQGASDPGRIGTAATAGDVYDTGFGGIQAGGGDTALTGFSLWRPESALSLFSAGGNLQPFNATGGQLPATFIAVAAGGSIFYSPTNTVGVELAPSPTGQLELLAEGSIIAQDQPAGFVQSGSDTSLPNGMPILISAADPATVSTPQHPAYEVVTGSGAMLSQNTAYPNPLADAQGAANNYLLLVAFGPDTPTTNLHANDPDPALIYAVTGDIVNLQFGGIATFNAFSGPIPGMPNVWYLAAKPARIYAGNDIVGTGTNSANPLALDGLDPSGVHNASLQTGLILNNNSGDVSTVEAGHNIIYLNQTIAGPGNLVVQAGDNVYQAASGTITSIGPIVDVDPNNRNGGAGVSVLGGVGQAGPDYAAFANAYLNPADTSTLIASGDRDYPQIVQQNDRSLATWLQQTFGYAGGVSGAWAYFQTLPAAEQDVFLRQVFFSELNQGGLEYNDPSSILYRSYLRGRDAIAILFPDKAANGAPLSYTGGLTMFGGSGIHTDFGGSIETLTPGGETLVGVEGAAPPSTAGVITQGSGDIDMYSLDSVLLGLSRIMTTFGGDIVIWSATGDINAGRGAKTTVVFTPPRRVYDNYGNVTLSPTVPSTGAGIATLDPIPQVPPGNINLVAPEGVIDAGEAGIRVSGNLNIAAVQVINATNIQVQGTTTGIPVAVAPNLGALTTASNTAGAAAAMAESAARQSRNRPGPQDLPSIITVEVIGYGGGDGTPTSNGTPHEDQRRKKPDQQSSYDPNSAFHVIGNGQLTTEQGEKLTAREKQKLETMADRSASP